MLSESKNKVIAGGIAAIAVAIGAFFWLRDPTEEPVVDTPAPVAPTPEPENHPVPQNPEQTASLPPLAESDASFTDALTSLFSAQAVEQFLSPQSVVSHIVVTVDNLPRKKVAERLKPIKPIAGQFAVSGADDALVLSESNYARYQPFVQLVGTADMEQVATTYFKYYPLFQQSYTDLGYPNGYFNNRLVEVIDHLLATPDVAGPVKLTQPGVMYEFADAKLENLSAGQKTMIRVGKANAAVLKTKLRELRAAIAKKQN
jgi:hypothetical protein